MAIESIRDAYLAIHRHDRFKAGLSLALAFHADDPATLKKGYETEPSLLAADRVFDFTEEEFLSIGTALGIDITKLDAFLAKRSA